MMPADEVIAVLERSPGIVGPLVRQADPDIVKRRPPSGEWSIHEHACHLAQVHPLFLERLDLMLREDDPVIRSYDPGRDDPADALLRVDLAGALRRFEADRRRLVERLRRLRPEDWARTARHEELNAYSVFIMFRHLALHDLSHAYQIEELLLRKDWPPPRAFPDYK
jgi:DinB family protein